MANVNTDLITNFEATPQVKNAAHELHGVKRVAQGTIALAAGDLSASDTVMLAPVPTNASITSIKLFNDDLDVTNLVSGFYTARVTIAGKTSVSKLIVK